MKIFADFLTSAASPAQFPFSSVPEVAFLGRSNVGKSSLLNSLTGTRLARVSNTPGRTQTINFFRLNISKLRQEPDLIFSDLPGYGYARVPVAIVGEWPKFIEPYLAEREALQLCICLVDSNIPPQKSDTQLIRWLEKRGRRFVVVATKADRISGNELARSLKALTAEFDVKPLVYSSKAGKGRDELWKVITSSVSGRTT
jgi:GTP-binding protein